MCVNIERISFLSFNKHCSQLRSTKTELIPAPALITLFPSDAQSMETNTQALLYRTNKTSQRQMPHYPEGSLARSTCHTTEGHGCLHSALLNPAFFWKHIYKLVIYIFRRPYSATCHFPYYGWPKSSTLDIAVGRGLLKTARPVPQAQF